jgi:hypothetical protein
MYRQILKWCWKTSFTVHAVCSKQRVVGSFCELYASCVHIVSLSKVEKDYHIAPSIDREVSCLHLLLCGRMSNFRGRSQSMSKSRRQRAAGSDVIHLGCPLICLHLWCNPVICLLGGCKTISIFLMKWNTKVLCVFSKNILTHHLDFLMKWNEANKSTSVGWTFLT